MLAGPVSATSSSTNEKKPSCHESSSKTTPTTADVAPQVTRGAPSSTRISPRAGARGVLLPRGACQVLPQTRALRSSSSSTVERWRPQRPWRKYTVPSVAEGRRHTQAAVFRLKSSSWKTSNAQSRRDLDGHQATSTVRPWRRSRRGALASACHPPVGPNRRPTADHPPPGRWQRRSHGPRPASRLRSEGRHVIRLESPYGQRQRASSR
jgi:hypothetical protein